MRAIRSAPLYVTRPITPDIDKVTELNSQIFRRGIYSNFGPLEQELTRKLGERFGTSDLLLFNNGTIALLIALMALPKRKGHFLTSPFTFPATVHCIKLAGYDVKFVDIDSRTLNIDPEKVADACDEETVGIVAVHVYGNPCNIEELHRICQEKDLYEIYDAAHCFDVYENGSAIYLAGDASIASFHATKIMHTGEGGAVFFKRRELALSAKSTMNFGIHGEDSVSGLGINGKLSEFNAAIGLAVLPLVGTDIERRRAIARLYDSGLSGIEGLRLPLFRPSVTRNYQYYPILIDEASGYSRDEVYSRLRTRNIFARKYFFPLLSNCLPYSEYKNLPLPNGELASRQALCLPIHSEMTSEDVEEIVDTIKLIALEVNR